MVGLTRRHKALLLPAILLIVLTVFVIGQDRYRYQLRNTLSYVTRPLWDKADGPTEIVPHYHADGLKIDASVCRLHGGWTQRDQSVVVLDAILMSSELDLLEIRMNELNGVVDYFFIIESNATFTGLPKETYFAFNRERFARFENKIVYR